MGTITIPQISHSTELNLSVNINEFALKSQEH